VAFRSKIILSAERHSFFVALLDFDLAAGTISIEILRTLIHGEDTDPGAVDLGVGRDVRLIR
jgi:hypothetical protein